MAELTAREIGVVSLEDALQLTALVAEKAPDRLERFTTRWLHRYVETTPQASGSEVAFVGSALAALRDERTRAASVAALSLLVARGARR